MNRRSGRLLASLLVLGLVSACQTPAVAPERFALEAAASPSLVVRVKSPRRVQAVVEDVDHLLVTVKAADGAEPTRRIASSEFADSDASVTFGSLASGEATVEVRALSAASRVLGKATAQVTVTPGVLAQVDVPVQLNPDYQLPAIAVATAPIAIDFHLSDGDAVIPSPALRPWGTEVDSHTESGPLAHMLADSHGGLWMASEQYWVNYYPGGGFGGGPASAGLAVDSTGRVWGASVDRIQSGTTTLSLSVPPAFNGFGIDGSDHFWVASGAEVRKLTTAGVEVGSFPVGGMAGALAVDPASGDVWVGAGRDLVRLTPAGVEAARARGVLLPGDVWREVAVDEDGSAWALQYDGHRVVKVAPDGALLGSFKVCRWPSGIVCDGAGHVYVVNAEGVYKLASDGTVLGLQAFPGGVDYLYDGYPSDVAIRSDGDVWAVTSGDPFTRLLRVRP